MENKPKVIHLKDGVYFFTKDTNFIHAENEIRCEDFNTGEDIDNYYFQDYEKGKIKLLDFLKENNYDDLETVYLGEAYQCYGFFIFDKPPKDYKIKSEGSGFNYGSCNIIFAEEPGFYLVLAEDD